MKRIIIGLCSTLCPAVILFAAVACVIAAYAPEMEDEIPRRFIPLILFVLVAVFAALPALWFIIIYDIIHIAKNPKLTLDSRRRWMAAIWIFNIFAIPVYWYQHLLRSNDEKLNEG